MHYTSLIVVVSCWLLTGVGLRAESSYWNQFRGPDGNGKSASRQLPVEFDDQNNLLWKTPIHGKGWSSPVVWGKQVWMTTAPEDGSKLQAVCVDLSSGSIEHDLTVFEVPQPEFCHPTNSYASCTPFVEQGRVYVHYGTYGTACLDTASGKILWQRRDLHCDHFRGPASSPIVEGDRLFVHFDGIDVQFVVALDKRTGKTLWQRDRDIDYRTDVGDNKKGYGTPTLIQVGDTQQLISPSAVETIAYNPASGEPIWRVRHGGMNAAARPLFVDGLVYISAGSGDTSLVAVRPDGQGDVSETHVVWQTGKGVPLRSSLVIDEGRLTMISDQGVVSCLDAATGKKLWTHRLPGEFWASPLYAGGKLYFLSKQGAVYVINAEAEFSLLAVNQFPAGFNASPAVADDTLLLRSFTHLYRFGTAK